VAFLLFFTAVAAVLPCLTLGILIKDKFSGICFQLKMYPAEETIM